MKHLFIALLVLSSITFFSEVCAQEVVVHPSVQEESTSKNTLRAIFGMRLRKWSNGLPIKVYVLRDDDPLHIEFSKSILHIFPYQLRRAWDRQVYSGTGQSPNEVPSVEEMRQKVSETPGAIGYLPLTELNLDMEVLYVR